MLFLSCITDAAFFMRNTFKINSKKFAFCKFTFIFALLFTRTH